MLNTYDADAFRGADIGNYPALVLNADFFPLEYMPLSTWNWQTSIHAVISDRVNVVAEYDRKVRSPSVEFTLPSVVALREYVHRRRHPSITRYNLITLRDKSCCCYCGKKFLANNLTFDHVIPRAQEGKHRWNNIVSSCLPCNQHKRDRTPEQAHMPLQWRPYAPTAEELARADYFLNKKRMHETWREFIRFEE